MNNTILEICVDSKRIRKLWLKFLAYSFLSMLFFWKKRDSFSRKKKKIETAFEYLKYLKKSPGISIKKNPGEICDISSDVFEEQIAADNKAGAIKAIAFYLPQFHPFPVNDAAWGKGFTEWSMVKKAVPQYPGHYHPKVPGKLGYYDLRDAAVMRKQVEMARKSGLHGFCFHYYWFNGTRLMEKPLESYLADESMDLPFCVNWANENWTRRWDGMDNEIIMAQNYSEADDRLVIHDLMRYFRSPRYIRIDGRPVFLVYRPRLFPDMRKTLDVWREECVKSGEREPFFMMCLSFGDFAPLAYGFDGAVEFPPHPASPFVYIDDFPPKNLSHDFQGNCSLYDEMVLNHSFLYNPALPSYPCVFPSWDNTARRGKNSRFYWGSTPDKYAEWIKLVGAKLNQGFPQDRRFLFINAWNEWGEGAYLEPDDKYGYAYLNATSRALAELGGNAEN